MEQKMLLPIVVIVLVGGFVIGYYAATFGGGALKAAKGAALPAGSQDMVSKAQYPEFFQAQTFTQFLKGELVSATGDDVVISQPGTSLAIKKPRVTNYYINTAKGRVTVAATDLKTGEQVDVMLAVDAETGKATNMAVSAAR